MSYDSHNMVIQWPYNSLKIFRGEYEFKRTIGLSIVHEYC
jgi:hypothetical protein